MKQLLISVGKKHDSQLASAIDDYTGRLQRVFPTEWLLLPPSGTDEPTARRVESSSVLAKLHSNDFVVILDERGQEMTSGALASNYEAWQALNKRLVFVIGGAYGISDELRERADFVWSLSREVFPHQIVRLLLVEQLYRSQTIIDGHPYHHQ
jgi:23S rRNA (pseudouridine1915-N3)-methyltransferase